MTPEIPRLPRISIRETNRRGLPPQRGQYDPSTPPSSCTTWGRQDPSGYLISTITSRLIPQPGEQPISYHALTLDHHCDLMLYRCDLFPPRGSLVLTDKDIRCPRPLFCCLPETIVVELLCSRIPLATRIGRIAVDNITGSDIDLIVLEAREFRRHDGIHLFSERPLRLSCGIRGIIPSTTSGISLEPAASVRSAGPH